MIKQAKNSLTNTTQISCLEESKRGILTTFYSVRLNSNFLGLKKSFDTSENSRIAMEGKEVSLKFSFH